MPWPCSQKKMRLTNVKTDAKQQEQIPLLFYEQTLITLWCQFGCGVVFKEYCIVINSSDSIASFIQQPHPLCPCQVITGRPRRDGLFGTGRFLDTRAGDYCNRVPLGVLKTWVGLSERPVGHSSSQPKFQLLFSCFLVSFASIEKAIFGAVYLNLPRRRLDKPHYVLIHT